MNIGNEKTISDKLKEMRLSAMSYEYENQLANVNNGLRTFEERFSDIVDSEWISRYNKKLTKYRKHAAMRLPNASYEEIIYNEDRNIQRDMMESLARLEWIYKGEDLIITGACGCGKTYIGCAIGNLACERFISVRYYRTQELLTLLSESRLANTYTKTLKSLQKTELLILDDFGLMELDQEQCMDLFEVIEARHERLSTMILSQFPVKNWYDFFKNATYADAILDRLVYHAYRVELYGESMRK